MANTLFPDARSHPEASCSHQEASHMQTAAPCLHTTPLRSDYQAPHSPGRYQYNHLYQNIHHSMASKLATQKQAYNYYETVTVVVQPIHVFHFRYH